MGSTAEIFSNDDSGVVQALQFIKDYAGATGSAATEEMADSVPDVKSDLAAKFEAQPELVGRIAALCGVAAQNITDLVQLPSHDDHGNQLPHMKINLQIAEPK